MLTWVSFIGLFLGKCRLHSPILDFNARRYEALKGLESFLPDPLKSTEKITAHPVWFNLIAAAALIKNSFSSKGGHLIADQRKLFYVRIPKSGSTSIASQMLKLILPDLKDESCSPTQLNYLVDAWLKHEVHTLQNSQGFTVVRHPLERLASVYHDIFTDDHEKPFLYQNYLGGILPRDLSFEAFVSRISRIPDRLKDQHFKPQHLFLKPYLQHGIPVKIFRLEYPEEIASFMKTQGLNLPHLHQGSPYNPADYYTDKSISLAQKMYTQDFKLFGYEQNFRG